MKLQELNEASKVNYSGNDYEVLADLAMDILLSMSKKKIDALAKAWEFSDVKYVKTTVTGPKAVMYFDTPDGQKTVNVTMKSKR
jgi:hypothetical protein